MPKARSSLRFVPQQKTLSSNARGQSDFLEGFFRAPAFGPSLSQVVAAGTPALAKRPPTEARITGGTFSRAFGPASAAEKHSFPSTKQ